MWDNLPTMNLGMIIGGRRLLLWAAGLTVAAFVVLAASFGPGVIPLIIMLAVLYGGFRLAIGPLPRFIARIGYSIRWKILVAISVMAAVSIFVSVVNIAAMDYMHTELHEIQDLTYLSPIRAQLALDDLANDQHGPFFSLMPFLSLLAALVALGLGVAIAVSVINPVRRMGEAMRRIASGDFSQPVQVHNRDELGELAKRINDTAEELAKLQQAALADERARALRERITQVTLAQEEERRRISRELHDGLGPSLAAIVNKLRSCQYMVRADPQQAERELDEVTKSLKGHIQDVRHLIYDLRPLAVDQLGLVGAVQQQLERFGEETGIQAFSSMSGDIALDPLAEVTVFRVVQECLSNVQKHANASQVEVRLQAMKNGLEVSVQDNGQGFDPHKVVSGSNGEGVGLLSMRERAELVRGRLSVRSSPGNGCQVVLYVPSREAEVGAHSNLIG